MNGKETSNDGLGQRMERCRRPVFGRPASFGHEPARDSVTQGSSGLEVLDSRYARGEITRGEYLERRRDLAGQSVWAGSVKSAGAVDGSGKR